MTVAEQHYDFKVKIDKVDSLTREDFNIAEIDWLLNEAQSVYVKRRYRVGFELNQKRIDDLATLHIKNNPLITPTLVSAGIYEVPLSSLANNYLFYTRGAVSVQQTDCDAVNVNIKIIQNDDINSVLNDPFNKASKLNGVPANFGRSSGGTGSSLYLYTDTLTIGDVLIEYIKQPSQIFFGGYTYIDGTTPATTNCELPDHTHPEIVDLAVQIASGIIEHPTYVQMKAQKIFEHE